MKSVLIVVCILAAIQTISASPAKHDDVRQNQDAELTVEIEGITYYFSDPDVPGVTWDQANANCRARNMTLASFDEGLEYANVRNWLKVNRAHDYWRWTSGRLSGSTWKWMGSGLDFTYSYWTPLEPNWGVGTLPCVDFLGYKGPSLLQEVGWEADDCDTRFDYLCEQPRAL